MAYMARRPYSSTLGSLAHATVSMVFYGEDLEISNTGQGGDCRILTSKVINYYKHGCTFLETTVAKENYHMCSYTGYNLGSLIDFVYPSFLDNYKDPLYFQERAIITPKNEVVLEINDRHLSLFPGEEKEYLSSDSLCEDEFLHEQFNRDLYSPDVLNGLNLSGLPKHKLILKVGIPVMLLRNIDQKNGLCNGTRLQKPCLLDYLFPIATIRFVIHKLLPIRIDSSRSRFRIRGGKMITLFQNATAS
ncbi:hypothetical protein LXL04_034344 [Taraxacum kok-saghyz]